MRGARRNVARVGLVAIAVVAVAGGCSALSGVDDLYIVDADAAVDGALDVADAGDAAPTPDADAGAIDAAIEAEAGPPASLGGVAHFLQSGQTVTAMLKVTGYPDEALVIDKNGPFAFAGKYAAGTAYTMTLSDATCWARGAAGSVPGDGGASAIDVRCRVIRQALSTAAAGQTSSDTFVAMPNIASHTFVTDVAANVMMTLVVPRCGYDPNPINGYGVVGIDVDGAVDDVAVHKPASSAYHASLSIVTVRPLAAGTHTVKVVWRRQLETSTPLTSFASSQDSVVAPSTPFRNVFTATVLDSLSTFLDVTTKGITTQLTAPAGVETPQPIAGFSTSTSGDAVVLAGMHVPDFSVFDSVKSSGVADLHVGGASVATHAIFLPTDDSHRSATLLYGDLFPATTVPVEGYWRKNYGNTSTAVMTLARGTPRIFAARFDKSISLAPTMVTTTDDYLVVGGTPRTIFTFNYPGYSTRAVKALVFTTANWLWDEQPTDGGELWLTANGTRVGSAYWRTQGGAEGYGATLVGIADLPAGSSTITVVVNGHAYPQSAHLTNGSGFQGRTTVQVIPLD